MSFFEGTKYHNWAAITGYLQTRYDAMHDGFWIEGQFFHATDPPEIRYRAADMFLRRRGEPDDWDGPSELN